MEWAWMLFTHLPDVHLDGQFFLFPEKPCAKPDVNVAPVFSDPVTAVLQSSVSIRVTTCNILTLKGKEPTSDLVPLGMSGPARQD